MAGILEGLYFHAIAFTDLQGSVTDGLQLAIYLAPILLILLSLGAALLVFWLDHYPLEMGSARAPKVIHSRTVKSKLLFMRISFFLLLVGAAAIFAAVLQFLIPQAGT